MTDNLERAHRKLKGRYERNRLLVKELQIENDRLRAALANSASPCVYCSLPKEQWAECKSGFPGCARGDDAMGCPELGAALEADALRAELDGLKAENKGLKALLEESDDWHYSGPQNDFDTGSVDHSKLQAWIRKIYSALAAHAKESGK